MKRPILIICNKARKKMAFYLASTFYLRFYNNELHCPVPGRATPSPALAARFRAQLSYLARPVGGEGENQQQSDEPMESVSRANQRPSARRRELELSISFPVFAGPPVTSIVPCSPSWPIRPYCPVCVSNNSEREPRIAPLSHLGIYCLFTFHFQ